MDLLRRIERLNRYREREARQELLVAERAQEEQEVGLRATNEAINTGRASRSDSASEHALTDAWLLRAEVDRRGQEITLLQRQRDAHERRGTWQSAARDVRTVERLAEIREEAEALDSARSAQRVLDDVGAIQWQRRRS